MSRAIFLIIFWLSFFYLSYLSWHMQFWTDEANSLGIALENPLLNYLIAITHEGTPTPLYFWALKGLLGVFKFFPFMPLDAAYFFRIFIGIIPACIFLADVSRRAWFLFDKWRLFWVLVFFVACLGTSPILSYAWQMRLYTFWLCISWFWGWAIWEKKNLKQTIILSTILAFTTPFAFFQIGAGAVFWCWDSSKRFHFKFEPLKWFLLPLMIGAFYVIRTPNYTFIWPGYFGFIKLIAANAKYWFIFPALVLAFLQRKKENGKKAIVQFVFNGILAILIIIGFFIHKGSTFEISNRYFIFLLPATLIPLFALLKQSTFQKKGLYISRIIGLIVILYCGYKICKDHMGIVPYYPQQEAKQQYYHLLSTIGKESCTCVVRDPTEPELTKYGAFMLEQIRNNAKMKNCENYAAITLLESNTRLAKLQYLNKNFSNIRNIRCVE